MSIEGRIAVDVNFNDTATAGGASILKKIQLVDATPYSSGKVAIVTGTHGTASVSISLAPTTYRGPDGEYVTFTNGVTRVAFAATGTNKRSIVDYSVQMALASCGSRVAVSEVPPQSTSFTVSSATVTQGTSAWTAVFYGT